MLKHETILNSYLLENNISENNILFGICCIVKLQGHKGNKKTQICYTASSPRLPHSYFFILPDACEMPQCSVRPCISCLFVSPFDILII